MTDKMDVIGDEKILLVEWLLVHEKLLLQCKGRNRRGGRRSWMTIGLLGYQNLSF